MQPAGPAGVTKTRGQLFSELGSPLLSVLPPRGMSLPNKISIFRILLVPCIVACLLYYHPTRDWLRYLCLGLFVVAVLSDAVDGYIARSQNQHSRLGALLDPIADKLLIISSLISLSTINGLPDWMRVPAWFNLIILSRDAVLIAGTMLLFGLHGTLTVRPTTLGKCTVVAQMLVIPATLLGLPWKGVLLVIAALLSVASGIGYLRVGSKWLEQGT